LTGFVRSNADFHKSNLLLNEKIKKGKMTPISPNFLAQERSKTPLDETFGGDDRNSGGCLGREFPRAKNSIFILRASFFEPITTIITFFFLQKMPIRFGVIKRMLKSE
jgi:hypothetical protein